MKKRAFLVLVLALAMVVSPIGHGRDVSHVDAVEDGGETAVSGGDAETPNPGGQPGTADKTALPVPTGLKWSDSWDMSWTGVPEAEGCYMLEVYKDGEWWNKSGIIYDPGAKISVNWAESFFESGTYKFRVCSMSFNESHESSEWSAFSAEKTYVRPAQELGTTKAYWDAEKPGTFSFSSVIGASSYQIAVKYTPEGSANEMYVSGNFIVNEGGAETEVRTLRGDVRDVIDQNGAGKYRVSIQAFSGDINKIAHGKVGEFSAYYDTANTAQVVGDKISDILNNGSVSASQAKDQVIEEIGKDTLKTAMQTDTNIRELVKALEDKYTAEKGITVEKTVSKAAETYVDANKISMVGAGLNTDAGKVSLEVAVPDKTANVNPNYYQNGVQLDIRLVNNGTSIHELAVPISVTMPIPKGLGNKYLVILHFHEDGSYEEVTPGYNGDGTVTFTVTGFSTFVFAEKTTPEAPETPETPGKGNSSRGSHSAPVSVDWNAVTAKIDAAEGNVDVVTGYRIETLSEVLRKLAGKNAALAMHTGTGLAFSVNGMDIQADGGDLIAEVSEEVSIPEDVKQEVAAGVLDSRAFGFDAKVMNGIRLNLHVAVGEAFAGKYANLYLLNESTGRLELAGVFQVTEGGQAMFGFPGNGRYVITITEQPTGKVVAGVRGGYTVVSGDTLFSIAAKNGVSLKALLAANPQIKDANKIYAGQVIQIR